MESFHGAPTRKQPHKSKRKAPKASHVDSNSVSVSALRAKIRDVSRVLDHAQTLPLDVRIEKERALAGYKQDLETAQHEKERQRLIKKYHMVRFFERQKATRNLKKLRIRLASAIPNTVEHQELENQVHCAEVDLNYTLYHPLMEKYVGLFPRQEIQKTQDLEGVPIEKSTPQQENKPAIWKIVESSMVNGTLQDLRDGRLRPISALPLRPAASAQISNRTVRKKRQDVTEAGQPEKMEVDEYRDESDGGFFEE
ncbi:MAG: hypothetical protein Q9170_007667 [Blastenia crenularia]